jgi:predicted NUDIX family NTP pyrophosphohydrolase
MAKKSAGVLLYRHRSNILEVLLVHPGGPFWKNKDVGAWSIPKGEFMDEEDPLKAALREFQEETGHSLKQTSSIALTPIKQKNGKLVYAWAIKGNLDADKIQSNLFEMEWPPKSGKTQSFPETDKAAWLSIIEAKSKIIPAQAALLNELLVILEQKAAKNNN